MKKFWKRAGLLLMCCLFAFAVFAGCGGKTSDKPSGGGNGGTDDEEEKPIETVRDITAEYPADGGSVTIANADVDAYAKSYKLCASGKYTDVENGADKFAGQAVVLRWSCAKEASSFTVSVALASDLANAQTYTATQKQVSLSDLYMNTTYYWRVEATSKDGKLTSDIFRFTTDKTPRTIDIEGVSNTRDIGGYPAAGGKKVKQGMVYRGAKLESITADGKTKALGTYGIRTDLDLRKGEESRNVLGDAVNYIQISAPAYYTPAGNTGINVSANQDELASMIKVFANEENYPVYFHCSIGRDRTGTLAMLLETLLGMDENDIYMEYEMSLFSAAGCSDKTTVRNLINTYFGPTYDFVCGYPGSTPAEKCEKFLLGIGVTADEIASIRAILLEE